MFKLHLRSLCFNARLLPLVCILICFSAIGVKAQAPNFRWAQGFITSSGNNFKIARDASNNIHFVGNYLNSVQVGPIGLTNAGLNRVVGKIGPNGELQWAVPAGSAAGVFSPLSPLNNLLVDDAGNTLIAGRFQNTSGFGSLSLTNPNPNVSTAFIAVFDPSGNAVRAQILLTNSSAVTAMALDSSDNVYIAGLFTGTADFGITNLVSGSQTGFFVKYDPSGNPIWAQMLDGLVYGIKMESTDNGFLTGYFSQPTAIFGGTTLTNSGKSDILVAKFDNSGNWLWAKKAGGQSDDYGTAIAADPAGNCYVSGSYKTTPFFSPTVKFDDVTLSDFGSGGETDDVFLAKYNSAGVLQWVTNAISSGTDYAQGLSVDAVGNAYLGARFGSASVNISGVTLTNSPGGLIGLAAKYSSDGNLLWVKKILGKIIGVDDLAIDQNGNSYLIGWSASQVTFDTTTAGQTNSALVWLAKIDGPQLSLTATGNQTVISWPTNAVGLHLESATALNLGSWSGITNVSTIMGNQKSVTIDNSEASRFFRLHGP